LICSKMRSFLGSPHEVIDVLALRREKGRATHTILAAAQHWSKRLAHPTTAETSLFIRSVIAWSIIHMSNIEVFLHKQSLQTDLKRRGSVLQVSHSGPEKRPAEVDNKGKPQTMWRRGPPRSLSGIERRDLRPPPNITDQSCGACARLVPENRPT
jgi:hypothetical protein